MSTSSNYIIKAQNDIIFQSGSNSNVIRFENDCSFSNTTQLLREVQPTNLVFVQSKDDFPPAVNGVITLEPNKGYYVTQAVDLLGDRIVTANEKNTILGTSSETSFLTSTGLGADVPFIYSNYTLPITRITVHDVSYGFYIDDSGGETAPLAIDWDKFNIVDVPYIGEIGTVDNFIVTNSAFLRSLDIKFTGTVGTIGFSDSLFTTDGPGSAGALIDISDAFIFRRFRMNFCSMVAYASTSPIRFYPSDISDETFILNTVNFAGGNTIDGVDHTNIVSKFTDCTGAIQNSASIADSYIVDNDVSFTTINTAGIKECITSDIPTLNNNLQKFVSEPNIHGVRYISDVTKTFLATMNITLNIAENQADKLGIYFGVRDVSNVARGTLTSTDVSATEDLINLTEIYLTTTGSNRSVASSTHYLVTLNKDEVIYPIIENDTSTRDILVEFMSIIIQKSSE